jgi:iron complex outermembrane recepter protein
VARPRMDDLAGGATYSTISDSASPLTGPDGQPIYWTQNSGGNPLLEPWRANAFDLAVEKYFSTRGYVSAAIYYKKLTSFIYPRFGLVDFTGVPLPPTSPGLSYDQADANRIGVGKVSTNGSGGSIKGAELSLSLPADILAPSLQGFGLLVAASWNRSEIHPEGVDVPLPGLSPRVINTTLYYERGGFSARLSDRIRGSFVGEVPAFDSALTINNVESESIVDAQIGYSFNDGPFEGLSVNLSGSNLTNEPFALYQVGASSFDVIKYEKYGPVYALSTRYKF